MGAIASATGVALSTATGIVDHLVKKGLVLRDADPQDRRLVMNILCLGAVFAVLLLVYRRLPRALFIILPVGLVIGWASLAMYVGGLALNPLTAVLGLIVVGIGTEFMVLLTSRYEEEKQKGEPPRCAMVIASSRMGRAIVTTGLTTLAGFGVLVASNFVMIRDFGVVTIIGVFLCLVSTIVVMPPLMVWFDERSSRKRLSKQ
jgi:predicted RND superfamily exporter protein